MKRLKRRWTLGGLMILIAVLAVPLTLYDQHLRRIEQRKANLRRILEAGRQAYARSLMKARAEFQKGQAELEGRGQGSIMKGK